MLGKILAFMRRDLRSARSYRLAYGLQAVGVVVPLLGLYFMSRVFNSVQISSVDRYGGNYLTFTLVGMIVAVYSTLALRSFTSNLGAAQASGSLEVLLLTRAKLPTIMIGWAAYPFLRSTIMMGAYLVVGLLLIGFSFETANPAGAVVTVVLIALVMGSLGLLSAAFMLVFKQGNPLVGIFLLVGTLLAGTVYPVSVLPRSLQLLGALFPQTHALEAVRLAMLRNYSVADLYPQLGVLVIYSAILIPLGLFAFKKALHRAKIEGSLAHY